MSREIVAVLGAGSWGTALAYLAAVNGHEVRLWARDVSGVAQGEASPALPGGRPFHLEATTDMARVISGAQWVISAIPCAAINDWAPMAVGLMEPQSLLLSGSKGLNPESGARSSQMWEQTGGLPPQRYVALSGPNLAREIRSSVRTSTVVASLSAQAATRAQDLLNSRMFRVYTNTDLVGVELGGALKNIVAIAAGICDGLGFGDNAKAAIMTRHWREMSRLAVRLGAQESTLFGLSGIGDLFATCASSHSRNHSLGERLAHGETLQQAQREVAQVAEGVHTTRAALHLGAEVEVELPVTEQVNAILFEGKSVRQAVEELMGRQGCAE